MMRIGIDLGGTKIEALALGADGQELGRIRVPSPRDVYAETLNTVVRLVQTLETKHGQQGSVGVAIPGTIVRPSGLVKNANSTWLNGSPWSAISPPLSAERCAAKTTRTASLSLRRQTEVAQGIELSSL
jgi:fructokinase